MSPGAVSTSAPMPYAIAYALRGFGIYDSSFLGLSRAFHGLVFGVLHIRSRCFKAREV